MALIYFLLAGLFAKNGSKRVIGGFTSFFMVLLWGPVGILFVLNSRRLDDEQKDLQLMEKYRVEGEGGGDN